MSSISLKTFSLLSHLGHRYEVHLCVVERTSKKLSHNSEHSKASLSPQADGQRGVRHARLLLQCCCCWQQPQRVPSQPKNEQKFTQLPASSSHCVVTDTFSLTPCALSCKLLLAPSLPGFPENQICPPEKSDFSRTRNLVSQSHKSI